MTLFSALWMCRRWFLHAPSLIPPYRDIRFRGAGDVPIFGRVALPRAVSQTTPNPVRGTIVGTYGITGTLDNQWFLKLLGRKAFLQGYGVVVFDWRAHGKTAEWSPTLTSDGLFEGEDMVRIAAQAKALGCPPPFWFTGYSLGGQLALWALKRAQDSQLCAEVGLDRDDVGGAAVICPNLDAYRSLTYLVKHPWGRHLERAIAQELQRMAWRLHELHPGEFDPERIAQARTIWDFDQALVIPRLGFPSVEAYYEASKPLGFLSQLHKPTLILYAADDPLFDPVLVPELQAMGAANPSLQVMVTRYGGHVGYISSRSTQAQWADPDLWWAWNRILHWCNHQG